MLVSVLFCRQSSQEKDEVNCLGDWILLWAEERKKCSVFAFGLVHFYLPLLVFSMFFSSLYAFLCRMDS